MTAEEPMMLPRGVTEIEISLDVSSHPLSSSRNQKARRAGDRARRSAPLRKNRYRLAESEPLLDALNGFS